MKARKTIAQYCVDASDKQLSEAYDILFGKDWKKTWSETDRANEMRSIIRGGTMPCIALEKWAKCIDFLRGEAPGDEYEIVREFVEWLGNMGYNNNGVLNRFINYRTQKHTVTLTQLKEAYAEKMGIEVDKIVVKEETK